MFSVIEFCSEMGQIGQDHAAKYKLMDKTELDHVSKVIGYHPSYLEHFIKTQTFIVKGDGPLPYEYRHYLAIMAAARHKCTYLINLHEKEFLKQGGDPKWLKGLNNLPPKLRAFYDINKMLAHRPWLLNKEHIERLNSWSLAEVVHAIVLLAHFHSLSSFVFSCGLTQELDKSTSSHIIQPTETKTENNFVEPKEEIIVLNQKLSIGVETLMAKMKVLSEKQVECSEVELNTRFKSVELQTAELSTVTQDVSIEVPQNISHYIHDASFTYQDFARRGQENFATTFRIQDYSWDDHGYSLVNRLYNDVGYLLDDKFRCAYNLTYSTLGGRTNVDTSKFRRAIWNYIQCIYGIRHDDYDYGEVNQLLERSLKMFIKTACCFPERITKQDYDNILSELHHSEKVHVNLMILEARNQAELLYALREIMRFMT